jgi:hypothetical protein
MQVIYGVSQIISYLRLFEHGEFVNFEALERQFCCPQAGKGSLLHQGDDRTLN